MSTEDNSQKQSELCTHIVQCATRTCDFIWKIDKNIFKSHETELPFTKGITLIENLYKVYLLRIFRNWFHFFLYLYPCLSVPSFMSLESIRVNVSDDISILFANQQKLFVKRIQTNVLFLHVSDQMYVSYQRCEFTS